MRRRYGRRMRAWIGLLLFAIITFFLLKSILTTTTRAAVGAVNEFYAFEQEGNFAKSWEMFHPFMKEKFQKGHYLQDRAHVFMNHFGVETFSYTLGKPEKLQKWQPSADGPTLEQVYRVPVTQVYKGKYGNFILQQDVFAVRKKKGEWQILWDYHR